MPTYEQWNYAIIQYFTQGERRGAAIFLDISEDRLTEIGLTFFSENPSQRVDWPEDFKSAVRHKSISRNSNGQKEVNLYYISQFDPNKQGSLPNGIAFLALMVLAAHNMAEDDIAADNNYFTRLRELL